MEVSVQEMTNKILNCIKQYTEEASEKITEVCKKESETLKENLKRDSPKGNRKKYAKSWKKDIKILSAQQKVNKNRYIPKVEELPLIRILSQMKKRQRKP